MRQLALMFLLTLSFPVFSSPLVTTDWLEQHLADENVKLFEVSVVSNQYELGHIPNASNLNWHTDLVDPVQRDIVSRKTLQAHLQKAGVNEGDTIILYGDNHNWFAAWGVWILETYGIANVHLLDGGRVKWEREDRKLTRALPSPALGNITVGPANEQYRARLADVVAAAKGQNNHQLVDIRSPDEFSGKVLAPPGSTELAMRAGHVPGAVNMPWHKLVNEDGTFRSQDELKKLYAEIGITGENPIITYCRIGERSSHSWFALHKLLGYSVRNYDGSWTEYGNAVGVPINNPSATVWRGQ